MVEMRKGSPELGYGEAIEAALSQPIPNMDRLRERKKGYNRLPIVITDPRSNEPVLNIRDYGLAGQAYYSRPNATTGEPIPEVPVDLYLRKSVVETLARINASLDHPEIARLFRGSVELYIEDALRPAPLQLRLYEEIVPALIRKNHPGITDEELAERRSGIIAKPSDVLTHPSPHTTGGVFDVILRYKQDTPLYVANSEVPVGHVDGDTSDRIRPDYFENHPPQSPEDVLARRNRTWSVTNEGTTYTISRSGLKVSGGQNFTDTATQANPPA